MLVAFVPCTITIITTKHIADTGMLSLPTSLPFETIPHLMYTGDVACVSKAYGTRNMGPALHASVM